MPSASVRGDGRRLAPAPRSPPLPAPTPPTHHLGTPPPPRAYKHGGQRARGSRSCACRPGAGCPGNPAGEERGAKGVCVCEGVGVGRACGCVGRAGRGGRPPRDAAGTWQAPTHAAHTLPPDECAGRCWLVTQGQAGAGDHRTLRRLRQGRIGDPPGVGCVCGRDAHERVRGRVRLRVGRVCECLAQGANACAYPHCPSNPGLPLRTPLTRPHASHPHNHPLLLSLRPQPRAARAPPPAPTPAPGRGWRRRPPALLVDTPPLPLVLLVLVLAARRPLPPPRPPG